MRYYQITEERYRNGTLQNALVKMAQGYLYGEAIGNTCYSYVGQKLAELNPPDATVRFWGRHDSNIVVHADVKLPDGNVISTYPPEIYDRKKIELVKAIPVSDFVSWVNASAQLSVA